MSVVARLFERERARRDVRPAAQCLSFACPKERHQRKGHPDCARSALNGPTTLRSVRPEGEQRTRPQPLASELRQLCSTRYAGNPRAATPRRRHRRGPGLRDDGQAGLGAGHTEAASHRSPFGLRYRSPARDRCGPSIPQGERGGAVRNEPRTKARSLTRRPGRPAPAVGQRSQRNDGTLGEKAKAYRNECRAGPQQKQGSNAFRPSSLVTFFWARRRKLPACRGGTRRGLADTRQAQRGAIK